AKATLCASRSPGSEATVGPCGLEPPHPAPRSMRSEAFGTPGAWYDGAAMILTLPARPWMIPGFRALLALGVGLWAQACADAGGCTECVAIEGTYALVYADASITPQCQELGVSLPSE